MATKQRNKKSNVWLLGKFYYIVRHSLYVVAFDLITCTLSLVFWVIGLVGARKYLAPMSNRRFHINNKAFF